MEFKLEIQLKEEEIKEALIDYLMKYLISPGAPWARTDVTVYSLNLKLASVEIRNSKIVS